MVLVEDISAAITPFLGKIQLLVGGIFGLYALFFIWKVYSSERLRRSLTNIRNEMMMLNDKFDKFILKNESHELRKNTKKK